MKERLARNDSHFFHAGTDYKAFEYFGAHKDEDGYVFRVWAPNAKEAYVVGLFNDWSENDPMKKVDDCGVWECRINDGRFGDGYGYQFMFRSSEGDVFKCDPYAFNSELAPQTGSRFYELSGYKWNDSTWMNERKNKYTREKVMDSPLNIYELHAESWEKYGDGSYLSYKELAEELAPYAVQMGYTHVELLPVSEYPSGDWQGYEVTGYYSPTSRFGSPKDFMAFVDIMHSAGIGVIIDCAPAYFPKGPYGLCKFDGGYVYEYRGEKADPKTECFDVAVPQVQSFIISNAVYWAELYHIDGIKYGDIATILSLDYNFEDLRWTNNFYGDRGPFEASAFFRRLNSTMLTYYPDVMMIAEDSSGRRDVTTFEKNGLGFTLSWNLGWKNETFRYAGMDDADRVKNFMKIIAPIQSAYSDKYVLPYPHNDVAFGMRSYLSKMPGDYDEKFSGARAFMTYLMTQPGKKLSFMGNEIGQFDEWDHGESVQWFLLDFDKHAEYQLFCAELNRFYLENPALWENDGSCDGFDWVDTRNAYKGILVYRRIDKLGNELTAVFNFASSDEALSVGVSHAGAYEEVFATDNPRYGGNGRLNGKVKTVNEKNNGFDHVIKITVPAYGASIFRCIRKSNPKK